MSGKGFNPKANFLPNIVFDVDITKVFGLSFEGFKTTNLNLHPKMKKDYFDFIGKCMVQNKSRTMSS